ncbi:MAG: SprT-like domain-containing protein [Flavobacteriaceae bacterium]|nr:SprT-like domain-containing protein [Flavobacteriaceae bacterium]
MQEILKKYIPEASISLVADLLNKYPHQLKIVNQRQTKHGDFRLSKDKKYQITINNNLNQYQFLLTLIHEVAHLVTHLNHKRVRPHGKEWKQTFQHLMLPFIHPDIYPKEILPHLANYLKNPKASTDSDVRLALAMKQFSEKSDKSFIFEIPFESEFIFKNRIFRKGNKRRTRFECLELKTKRIYLFNQNAEVELIVTI